MNDPATNGGTMTKTTTYDPVIGRYRATCPVCGYVAVRAKREAADHALAQHRAYSDHCAVKR